MPHSTWSVQDAKNQFSAVIRAAGRRPQTVTKRGKPVGVLVDAAEFERLSQLEGQKARSFADHLLAMPADDGEFEPLDATLRNPRL